MLYKAQPADNNSVRLRPHAVFAPGGWLGYAWQDDKPPPTFAGFKPNPTT